MEIAILIVIIIVGFLVLGLIGLLCMWIDDLHAHMDQLSSDVHNLERAVRYECSHKQEVK